MNRHARSKQGFTLVELILVMGMLSVVLAIILSAYSTVVKQMATTRKMVKTEADLVNIAYPLFREIESAGFGVQGSGTSACLPAIATSGSELVIHSTYAGDEATAGLWSQISGTNCSVNLPLGTNVVIIDPAGKRRVALDTVAAGVLSGCQSTWQNMVAYAIPGGALECYETAYGLRAYTSGVNARPATCATGTQRFSRSVDTNAGGRLWNGMLDCVLDARYIFGCVNKFSGNVSWQTSATCNAAAGDLLRFVRIALVVQDSTRQDGQVAPAQYQLFSDAGLTVTVNMNANPQLRLYRWRIIEKTIILRNLE